MARHFEIVSAWALIGLACGAVTTSRDGFGFWLDALAVAGLGALFGVAVCVWRWWR